MTRYFLCAALVALLHPCLDRQADAFGYIFAGETNGPEIVTHPIGYNGSPGVLNISVGIDLTSVNATSMQVPVQNVVTVWNGMTPTTQNVDFSTIAGSEVDFESVLLHEMGHSLGLSHVNAASESGLAGANQNYTKATNGADNSFGLNAGADGVRGSHDDVRGDDVNLNWFHQGSNDPFDTTHALGVVDSTTYSVQTANLPVGDLFSTNPDRTVATLARYNEASTEASMQQGTFFGEVQRTLGADDVAGRKYANSGLDEVAGTADDYTVNLTYNGLVPSGDVNTDIIIDFDNAQTGFAVSISNGFFINTGNASIESSAEPISHADEEGLLDASGNLVAGGRDLHGDHHEDEGELFSALQDLASQHVVISSTAIFFHSGFNWHFNNTLLVPEPATASLLLLGAIGMVTRRRA